MCGLGSRNVAFFINNWRKAAIVLTGMNTFSKFSHLYRAYQLYPFISNKIAITVFKAKIPFLFIHQNLFKSV